MVKVRALMPTRADSVVPIAEVAELVDALASGASGGNPVEVQVLSSAPVPQTTTDHYKSLNTLIFIGYLAQCCSACLSFVVHHSPNNGARMEPVWSAQRIEELRTR